MPQRKSYSYCYYNNSQNSNNNNNNSTQPINTSKQPINVRVYTGRHEQHGRTGDTDGEVNPQSPLLPRSPQVVPACEHRVVGGPQLHRNYTAVEYRCTEREGREEGDRQKTRIDTERRGIHTYTYTHTPYTIHIHHLC